MPINTLLSDPLRTSNPPDLIEWELTSKCNLRCRHCWHQGQRAIRGKAPAGVMEMANRLAQSGVHSVALSGGEPLLFDSWAQVASTLSTQGVFVQLISNGALLGDHEARTARDSGVGFVWLSLDGDRESHEWVRGSGTFDPVLRAAAALSRSGVRFGFITALLRPTLPSLDALARVVDSARPAFWQVWLAMRTGPQRDSLWLSAHDAGRVRDRLLDLRDELSPRLLLGDNLRPAHRCEAGRRIGALSPDGVRRPCVALPLRAKPAAQDFDGCHAMECRWSGPPSVVPSRPSIRQLWRPALVLSAVTATTAGCTPQRVAPEPSNTTVVVAPAPPPTASSTSGSLVDSVEEPEPIALGARRDSSAFAACCMAHMLVDDCDCSWDEVDVPAWGVLVAVPSSGSIEAKGQIVVIGWPDRERRAPRSMSLSLPTDQRSMAGDKSERMPSGSEVRFRVERGPGGSGGEEHSYVGRLTLSAGRTLAFECRVQQEGPAGAERLPLWCRQALELVRVADGKR